MLQQLKVQNLAIVEEAAIQFGRGLNIITGETGAGKSVLMGALNLVLGERADKSIIRSGADEGRVEASFALEESTAINALLEERGLPLCEEGILLIRRVITTKGAGRILINDSASTAQTLREIGPLLVDIHGPYDQQSLLKQDFQRSLLDAYGKCSDKLELYRSTWSERQELRSRLEKLSSDSGNVGEEIDRLRYMVNEIQSASLTESDEDELISEHSSVANAEEILSSGAVINEVLIDGEISAGGCLLQVQNKLEELVDVLPEANEWLKESQSAILLIQELSSSINATLSRIDADPARLQYLEERMALVQKLKRKYGGSVEAINQTLANLEERLDELENRTEKIEKIQSAISSTTKVLTENAAALSQQRHKASGRLAKAITTVLRDLGFANASFFISLRPCEPAGHGADEIIFEFAPNPGEPAQPLKSIASSGEVARVMLAIKAVLAAHDSIPILVFDEIDANIGGETGRAVGQKLKQVAASHQVISITHLPQSAVYGEQHVKISKEVHDNRTKMKAKILNHDERIDEIARMLGGKGFTSVIENHAREMLESAF